MPQKPLSFIAANSGCRSRLGASPKSTTAYVYMCEVSHLSWWYDAPEKDKVAEIGVFRTLPAPLASESVEVVLEAALRARRTGLR